MKKKVKYGIFKVDAYPPRKQKGGIPYEADDPDPKAALGPCALCMVLSVCAPALAAEPDGDWTSENDKNSKTFTFKMPEGNVSLSAEYRKTYLIYETAGVAEFFVDGKQVNQAPAASALL